MVDAHCHLDQYPDPAAIAREAQSRGVTIVGVTALPSHFAAGRSHARSLPNVRLALGLHPLLAEQHEGELELFERLLPSTSYVGEVGLDGSRHGRASYDTQVKTFRFVLACVRVTRKLLSVHSRGAEDHVLSLLEEFDVRPVVLHWYTGSSRAAEIAVRRGHFFSVNSAMIASRSGQRLLNALPRDRILTETDGPYVHLGSRPALPWDVFDVASALEKVWGVDGQSVRAQLRQNIQIACDGLTDA
jgi:TatD DNase family protein